MSLENIVIATSPLSGRIYAGYSRDGGRTMYKKVEVTQQVVNAMSAHMHITGEEYECQAGELIFKAREE